MGRGKSWLVPLTGLAFFVVTIVSITVRGEPPDPTKDSAREIVDFYVDNEGPQFLGAILAAIAATLYVFFGGCMRRVLRDAEGARGMLSAVAFAGTIIFAAGVAIDATITVTLAETADEIDPIAVQTLSALYHNDFVPLAVGNQIFLLATGISVLLHGALPKWIGWIAIVLGVLATTPVGFFAFIGTGVLVAIISVMLALGARAAVSPPAPRSPSSSPGGSTPE